MPNKGYKQTEEHIRNSRESHLGQNSWLKGKKVDRELYPNMGHFQKHTEDTRIKIGILSKGREGYWLGKKLSEEHKQKIGDKNRGHKNSEEARNKISIANKGKVRTEEVRKKISESRKELFKEGKNIHGFEKGYKMSEEHKNKIIKARAKQILPLKDTKIEVKIQSFLKQLGIDFLTHQYPNIEHNYQCDILIPSMNLVIECDGNYWHKYPIGNDLDHIRTKELLEKGFKVLRLWEFEINKMSIDKFKELVL